jgi:hypothetical protein
MSGSIGGIDASIPLQAGKGVPAPANPLEMMSNFANIQNALNRNRLFPGEQELQAQSIERGGIGNKNLTNQTVYTRLTPLLALPEGGITHSNLTSMLASIERNGGLPTNGVLQHIIDAGPKGDGPEFDKFIRSQVATQSQSPEGALRAVAPVAATFSNGQDIIPATVGAPFGANPGAIRQSTGAIPTFPSRSELAAQIGRPVNGDEATKLDVPPGTIITETMAQRLGSQGATSLGGPATASIVGVDGRPVGPGNPPRLGQVGQPIGARPVVTSMPPGADAALKAGADAYNADSARANSYPQRVFPLRQAMRALANAQTGPGSETVNHIRSFINAQAPEDIKRMIPNFDPNKIADYDEAVKYLAQYAMNQPGAANSDMSRGLAQTANASTKIDNKAARQVVVNALGLENMQQAALVDFNQKFPVGNEAQYSRWLQSNFIPSHDPRGFSWDEQTPEQQKAAVASMSRAEKARLVTSIELARKLNLTGVPGGQ